MHLFWNSIIEPLLKRLEPRVVVEVGSDQGFNTSNLANFAQRTGAVLHVIDPLPKYDVDEWQNRYGPSIVFHQAPSLEVLGSIDSPDVLLIDGDHNWYTVFHELTLLEDNVADDGTFPLVMLHDVGWPYGRRDLYYEPDRVPPGDRHPYRRGGMRPGQRELDPSGGLNAHRFNALEEGGPRNGVLTAIEDMVDRSRLDLRLVIIPAINGLGLLYPSVIADNRPTVATFIDSLQASDVLLHLLETLEDARLEAHVNSIERASEVKRGRRELANMNREIGEMRRHADVNAGQRDRAVAARNAARDELKVLRGSLRDVRSKEKVARHKVVSAHAQIRRLKAQINSLKGELARARSESANARQSYEQLRSRRSVRFALGAASMARPLFRLMGGTQSQDGRDASPGHETDRMPAN
jgi:Methyltransferase domain